MRNGADNRVLEVKNKVDCFRVPQTLSPPPLHLPPDDMPLWKPDGTTQLVTRKRTRESESEGF
jgi:hypothetical protein